MDWLRDAFDIIEAVLACVGGLKVLARYTKTKADDAVLEKIEKPLAKALELARKFKPKRKL